MLFICFFCHGGDIFSPARHQQIKKITEAGLIRWIFHHRTVPFVRNLIFIYLSTEPG